MKIIEIGKLPWWKSLKLVSCHDENHCNPKRVNDGTDQGGSGAELNGAHPAHTNFSRISYTTSLSAIFPFMGWTFTHVPLFLEIVDLPLPWILTIHHCIIWMIIQRYHSNEDSKIRTVCTWPEYLALYPEWRPVSPFILNPYIELYKIYQVCQKFKNRVLKQDRIHRRDTG